jgi:thermitase
MERKFVKFSLILSVLLALFIVGCGEDQSPITSPDQGQNQLRLAPPAGGGGKEPGEILVKFKPGAAGAVGDEIPGIGVRVVKVKPGDEEAEVARFKNNPNVEYAEVNGTWEALHDTGQTFTPNDTYFNTYQWNMKKIDGPLAWHVAKGSNTVKIAILDTGIKSTHEDLSGKVVLKKNFTTSTTVEDKQGHGTHVSGIAAAVTDNGKGVAGVGFNSSLMNGKVLGDNGSGAWSWIANGIIWAADNRANAINMSLGGSSGSQTVLDAVNYAWGKGVVLVAAAGNSSTDAPSYPAYYDNVIAVAATDKNDALASFSNFGTWVDVAAPGVDILSSYIRYKPPYVFMSGTSMASPHVAGLAGLLASQGKNNAQIRSDIENTTDNKGSYPIANGRINAHKAVDSPAL